MNLILLAAEHPDDLASAIFVHGAPRVTGEDMAELQKSHPELTRGFAELPQLMGAPNLSDQDRDRRFGEFLKNSWFPLLFMDPVAGRAKLQTLYEGASFSWRHFQYSSGEAQIYDFTDRLPQIKARSLVIAGAHDMFPPARVRELSDGIQGAEFVLFEHSGHFSPVEEPAAFRKTVLTFLGAEKAR